MALRPIPIITPQEGIQARQAVLQDQQGQRAIAAGAADLAAGVRQASDALQDRDKRRAEVWASKALAEARAHWTEQQVEREAGAEGDAAGYADAFKQDFEGFAAGIIDQAPAAVRDRVQTALIDMGGSLRGRAMAFEATKRVSHRLDEIDETLNIERNALLSNPGGFGAALGNVTTAIDEAGLPADKRGAALRAAKEGLALSALQSLTQADPAGTLRSLREGQWDAYLDADRKGPLMAGARAELKRREAEGRARAAEQRRRYLDGFGDTLDYARGTGAVPGDTPYTYKGLISSLGREDGEKAWRRLQQAQEDGRIFSDIAGKSPAEIAEARAALAARTVDVENYAADAKALAAFDRAAAEANMGRLEDELAAVAAGSVAVDETTFLADPGKLDATFGPAVAAEVRALRAKALDAAERGAALSGEDTARIAALRSQMAAGLATADDFRAKQQALADYDRQMQAVLKARAEDPAAFVQGSNGFVRGLAERMAGAEGEQAGPAALDYAAAMLAEQERIGIPSADRRILSGQQAKQIVAGLATAPTDQADQQLAALLDQWGRHRTQILRELQAAGLPGGVFTAATLRPGDPVTAQELIEADRNADAIGKAVPDLARKDLAGAIETEMEDFRRVFAFGGGGGAMAVVNQRTQAAERWARLQVARGMDPRDAAEAARERFIDNQFRIEDSRDMKAVLPADTPDEFIVLADRAKTIDALRRFNPAPIRDGAGNEILNMERTIATAARSGVWTHNETGDGLVLMVPVGDGYLPLRGRDRALYEIRIGDEADAEVRRDPGAGLMP